MFRLSSRMGENFKSTFNSAQKELAETQKKIQELNHQQKDITAYQKQQSAVSRTAEKLDLYRRQLAQTQAGLEELKKSTADTTQEEARLTVKETELKNRILSTELALSDKNRRLAETGERLRQAGIDTAGLTKESERLSAEMLSLKAHEEKAAQQAEQFGRSGTDAMQAIAEALDAAGIAAAVGKIAQAYKECVSISMAFGGTMSTVAALSGASAEEMQELTEKAKQLGADTAYTATQAAEAMTYMGMAGWDADEMLDGMSSVINLAAASGEELALVSDIVTDNLTAFGLTAKDTAHFADVLAAAATNSNTSVGIMGETFKGSAAVAGALGYSIEDVAAAVGLMANSGVKGSIAGTALKNIFNGLLNGAVLTADAFGEVEFSALNADGTISSFSETISELRGYFEQMTDAERVQNATVIAGQRGYNGLLEILNSTDKDYQSLTDSINSCAGAASRMADIKLDNLQGDVTLLRSAADGLRMTIGNAYDNELRKLAQAGTEILSGINSFCEKPPAVIKGIIGIGTGIATALVAYKSFTAARRVMNAVTALSNTLTMAQAAATGTATAAQVGLNAAMSANPIGLVVTAVGALAGGIAALALSYESAVPSVKDFTEAAQGFNEAMEETSNDFDDTQTDIAALADTADFYIDRLEELEGTTGENAAASEEYHNILALLTRTVPELADYIDLETNSIKGGTAALREHTVAYRENAEEQARQEYLNEIYDQYSEVVKEVAENKIKLTQEQLREQKALEKAAQTQERMNVLMAEAEKLGKEYNLTADTFLTDEYYELEEALLDYEGEAVAAAKTQEKLTQAIEQGEQAINDARDTVDMAVEALNYGSDSAESTADEFVSAYDAVSAAVSNVSDRTEELLAAYQETYQAAYESVSGQYNLWTQAADTLPVSIGTITDALESQREYWDNYNYNLLSLSERTEDIEGLGEVIASFADGSADSVNAIAGMADAADEELRSMVEIWREQQKIQQNVAETLAQYKTDIYSDLGEITDSMEEAVEGMDMSDAAAAAAKDTIQAYADAILAGKNSVSDAADVVAMAAASALSYAGSADADLSRYAGYTKIAAQNAYASGTTNAQRGIALVGEESPELVAMRGGETVFNAENTRAILSGGGTNTQITISPHFVVNGDLGGDTESKLQEMSERLVDMVKDALEEAGIDRQRNAYA